MVCSILFANTSDATIFAPILAVIIYNSYIGGYGRRPKRGASGGGGSVQCAMCETVTELDPSLGLDAFKRRVKKRKAGEEVYLQGLN